MLNMDLILYISNKVLFQCLLGVHSNRYLSHLNTLDVFQGSRSIIWIWVKFHGHALECKPALIIYSSLPTLGDHLVENTHHLISR